MSPARILLDILERDLRPEFFDEMSRDDLRRFNRAVYRWHSEARARIHGRPPQTAALFAAVHITPRKETHA